MILIEPHDIMKGKINEKSTNRSLTFIFNGPNLSFHHSLPSIQQMTLDYSTDGTRLLNRRNSTTQQTELDYSTDGTWLFSRRLLTTQLASIIQSLRVVSLLRLAHANVRVRLYEYSCSLERTFMQSERAFFVVQDANNAPFGPYYSPNPLPNMPFCRMTPSNWGRGYWNSEPLMCAPRKGKSIRIRGSCMSFEAYESSKRVLSVHLPSFGIEGVEFLKCRILLQISILDE